MNALRFILLSLLGLLLAILWSSCTVTRVSTPQWRMTRCSVLQKVDVPTLSVDTNGVVHLNGYKNSGGNEELQAFIKSTLELLKAAP